MLTQEFSEHSRSLVQTEVQMTRDTPLHDAVQIEGLWWRYPTFSEQSAPWTLRDINLRVRQGECLGITGSSGAGKTTLCRTLPGILPYAVNLAQEQRSQHFRGSIQVLGEPVHEHTATRQKIGMVFQDPENQFLRMSVLHELSYGLQAQNLPRSEIVERVHQALCWVGLEHLWRGAAYIHPSDLSGGQKQRIAIASFLALRPQILILDEPTSDLDPVGKREVIETIARLRNDYQLTVILVEQDPDILTTFCDRIALLHQGRIEFTVPTAEFYRERELLERCGAAIGEFARISWSTGYTFAGRPPLNLEEAVSVVEPVIEQRVISSIPHKPPQFVLGEAIAEARGVTYHYEDGTQALHGVDVDLYRGEMLALLGANGSGKTTFAKVLAGIYRSAQGRISIDGQDLARKQVRAMLPQRVGYVFQNPDHQLFCRKVRDEVEYGLKNLGVSLKERRQRVTATLEAVDLIKYSDEDPLFLSKGQRQRLAVAAVLAMGSEILIVDEPTTGQDYQSIVAIMHLLQDLQRQGKTILIITHDMTLVAEYCQRVVAFKQGRTVFTGTPTELFMQPEIGEQTGLRPPVAAALTHTIRRKHQDFPALLTVADWNIALSEQLSNSQA